MEEQYIYVILIAVTVASLYYAFSVQKSNKKPVSHRDDLKQVVAIRLQAYERLTLFLERCRPQSLLLRTVNEVETGKDLQVLLLQIVREEFEHNFSQQIYVSEALWKTITSAKEELVHAINQAAEERKENTTRAFSQKLLELYHKKPKNFIDVGLQLLRNEVRQLQK